MAIHFANPVHRSDFPISDIARRLFTSQQETPAQEMKPAAQLKPGVDHLPSMILAPSHTAPTKPLTMMVMTALKV
jgi:hypothetical protein